MKRKGFTLVELIVVIVIIGIISVILIASITNSNRKSREKMLATKIETTNQALVVWAQNNRKCFFSDSSSNDDCLLGLNKGCIKDSINDYLKCETTYGKMAIFGVIKYDDNTKVLNPVNNSSMNNNILTLYYNLNTKIFCIDDSCIKNKSSSDNFNLPQMTVTPSKDEVWTKDKTVQVNISAGSKKLKKSGLLKYAWIPNENTRPSEFTEITYNELHENEQVDIPISTTDVEKYSGKYYLYLETDLTTIDDIVIGQRVVGPYYFDNKGPSAPTMTFVDNNWNTYTGGYTTNTIYAAQASGKDENTCTTQKGAPSGSVDGESGVAKYQISKDRVTWIDYNYNCEDNMYKFSTSGTHTRYFRACDYVGNCGTYTAVTANIQKSIPSLMINAIKNGTNVEVASNTWSDKGLNFNLVGSDPNNKTLTIYYCQSNASNCVPFLTTANNSTITSYNNINGEYYFRAIANNEDNIYSESMLYHAKVDTTIPNVEMVAKDTSGKTITSGTSIDKGLNFTFNKLTDGPSGSKIYYCKDTTGTCNPDIEVASGTTITDFNTLLEEYYINYKIVSGAGISSETKTFKAVIGDYANTLYKKITKNGCKENPTTIPGQAVATTDEGLICGEDDYGTTYYFRGAVENNYVIFAGMCWRIVRVDGNNNTKLVLYSRNKNETNPCLYSEDILSFSERYQGYNERAFTSSNNYTAAIGYMYGTINASSYDLEQSNNNSSAIKNHLENWYNTNIGNDEISESQVADVVWCNDRNVVSGNGYGKSETVYQGNTRIINGNPSFKCNDSNGSDKDLARFTKSSSLGNGKLSAKIGLLTADEVAFAGATSKDNNTSYYLYNNALETWWGMTPDKVLYAHDVFYGNATPRHSYTYNPYVWGVKSGRLAEVPVLRISSAIASTANNGSRPAISLKADTLVNSYSDGSAKNPYIITNIVDNVAPSFKIVAKKNNSSAVQVISGNSSNVGLNYTFNIIKKGSSDIVLYFCKDNTPSKPCTPNNKILPTETLTAFNLVSGEYYLRVKAVNGSGIESNIESYHAIVSNDIVNPNTLLSKIKPNTCKTASTIPGQEVATTNEGINCTEDDYGTSYYYRGAVENNYVVFAGMCWRIVRIDGNDNIKLVLYSGNKNETNPCAYSGDLLAITNRYQGYNPVVPAYSSNYETSSYKSSIGYMYGTISSSAFDLEHSNTNDSLIKTHLEDWYNTNIGNDSVSESQVADVVWCNDQEITSGNGYGYTSEEATNNTYDTTYKGNVRITSGQPSLKCSDTLVTNKDLSRFTVLSRLGNGKLSAKIGLLTADEIAFAGATSKDNNTSYYLYKNALETWWTLTPDKTQYTRKLTYYSNYTGRNEIFKPYVWAVSSGKLIEQSVLNDSGIGSHDSSGASSKNLAARPAIALKPDTLIATEGDGTAKNPYIVQNQIDNIVPSMKIIGKKNSNAQEVKSGTESDVGLKFSFNITKKGNSNIKVYYCKDDSNECIPNIIVNPTDVITAFNLISGEYYVRAKAINGSGIESNIESYHAKVSESIINSGTLLSKIKPKTCITPKTTPGQQVSEATEAEISCTQDNFGTSYYYRGAVENNYVVFANMCWRIVRIDGNNNIKLVLYNGTKGETNPCISTGNTLAYSSRLEAYNDRAVVSGAYSRSTYTAPIGYMYGTAYATAYDLEHSNTNNSHIKTHLEAWYNTNIGNDEVSESQVADVIWCNDKSVTSGNGYGGGNTIYKGNTRIIEGNPNIKCENALPTNKNLSRFTVSDLIGNGKSSAKIGLLTADEIAFAGATSSSNNTSYYLYNNALETWWTLTPDKVSYQEAQYMAGTTSGRYADIYMPYIWGVSSGKLVENATLSVSQAVASQKNYAVRPAISLKSNVLVLSEGNGTVSNPYIIANIIDEIKPKMQIVAKKNNQAGTEVSSGVLSDTGLNFSFNIIEKGDSEVNIYFCKDTTNECNPNIKASETDIITIYNLASGNYYIRAKAVNGGGLESETIYYHANVSNNIISSNALINKIKPNNTANPVTKPGQVVPTESGMYTAEDDYGTSYYYRGAVENNYVSFANMCWRIVRIDGNDNIKLVLYNYNSSDCTQVGGDLAFARFDGSSYTTKFNNTSIKNAYIGYMYGTPGSSTYNAEHENKTDSTILTNLKKWYDAKFSASQKEMLADVVWCNDKRLGKSGTGINTTATFYASHGRIDPASTANPSLKCGSSSSDNKISKFTANDTIFGNGMLKTTTNGTTKYYKVGLLTVDEVAFAGGVRNTANSTFYLNKNATSTYWWTMSPFGGLSSNTKVNEWIIYGTGDIVGYLVDTTYALRPAISLKPNVIATGTGSAANPYVIQ